MALPTIKQRNTALQTSPRFIRRLIFERRIPFLKLGHHVRLLEADLDTYITASRVDPNPVD
jgi:excisionase family DNA binding protein